MKRIFILAGCVFLFCIWGGMNGFAGESGVKGWVLSGSRPDAFSVTQDTVELNGQPQRVLLLQSVVANYGQYAALSQTVKADKYRNFRVQFSAYIKSENVGNNTGFWLQVYQGNRLLVLNNMADKTISGTTEWKKHILALDIPRNANKILIGVYLTGKGKIWLGDLSFGIVDKTKKLKDVYAPQVLKLPVAFNKETGIGKISRWGLIANNFSFSKTFSVRKETTDVNGQQSEIICFESAADNYKPVELIKTIKAGEYKGTRIEWSADVKTESIRGKAVLFMCEYAVCADKTILSNINDGINKGTTSWTKYSLALDVSDDSERIEMGVFFSGMGKILLGNMNLKIVGKAQKPSAVPRQDSYPEIPVNLELK